MPRGHADCGSFSFPKTRPAQTVSESVMRSGPITFMETSGASLLASGKNVHICVHVCTLCVCPVSARVHAVCPCVYCVHTCACCVHTVCMCVLCVHVCVYMCVFSSDIEQLTKHFYICPPWGFSEARVVPSFRKGGGHKVGVVTCRGPKSTQCAALRD